MSPGSSAPAQPRQALPTRDLFSAANYSAWVRGTMDAAMARPDPAILYGSSISEPTSELMRLMREAFSEPLTSRYISVFSEGNHFVADAICARYGVSADQVLTTTGVRNALGLIVKGLSKPGDRILIEEPGFDLLKMIAVESGAKVDPLPRAAPDFRFDLDRVAAQWQPGTRLAVITNLHNPSGVHLDPDEIRALAALLAERNAMLVVDEVYADLVRPSFAAAAALLAPNIVSTNSLTKAFGLHALKCGWIIAHPDLRDQIQAVGLDAESGISKLAHAVAAHVLESADLFDRRAQGILAANRAVLEEHVGAMRHEGLIAGEIPQFGCMYFPRVCGISDTLELARTLWQRFGILVAPGEFFGLAGHVRIGFGEDRTELNRGLGRLHAALKTLRDD